MSLFLEKSNYVKETLSLRVVKSRGVLKLASPTPEIDGTSAGEANFTEEGTGTP